MSRRQLVTLIAGILPILGIVIAAALTHNGAVAAIVFVVGLLVTIALNLLAGNASRTKPPAPR